MKQVLFILSILLISTFSLAQKVEVRDTINAAAYQNFDVSPFVLGNILRIDYSIDLLDANLQKVRECKNFSQKPKKEDFAKATAGGRGTTFILFIKEAIEQTGTFYIREHFKPGAVACDNIRAARYRRVAFVEEAVVCAENVERHNK